MVEQRTVNATVGCSSRPLAAMPYKDKEKQKEYQLWVAKRREDWFNANGPCRNCGSWKNLELDHIDPSTKVSNKIWSWSEERRNEEIAKCQILCEDCHTDKTAKDLRKMFEKFPEHGTNNRYNKGCKCNLCMEAMRIHWRQYRLAKKQA